LNQLGDVQCWGRNEFGQLGIGTFGVPAGSLTAVAIKAPAPTAGEVCKVKGYCDDKNPCTLDTCDHKSGACSHVAGPDGVLDPTAPQCPSPSQVCSAGACKEPQFKAISSGDAFTCALNVDSSLTCWGYNVSGQMGTGVYGAGTDKLASVPPTAVLDTTGVKLAGVLSVSAKGSHTCAVMSGGQVRCWGTNTYGEAGTGELGNTYTKAMKTLNISTATSLGIGEFFGCAVLGNGSATCWGRNEKGQLGGGDTLVQSGLVAAQGLTGLASVSGGKQHTCAVDSTGKAWCWGLNSSGQLGNGQAVNSPALSATPVPVVAITDALSIHPGTSHTCAVRKSGTVSCWGSGQNGKTGTGSSASSSTPTQMLLASGVTQMAVGDSTTCVVAKGRAMCTGIDSYGEVGVDTALQVLTDKPAMVPGMDQVKQVSVGANHACALRVDGSVWCWGKNDHGQLGDAGAGASTYLPKLVQATVPK
jgi:alpha-tubulin suppressor-like RCC1 family protein